MTSPLTTLNDALRTDMESVNAAIMRNMESPIALIPQLAGYLIAAGGKRIRPLLTLAATGLYDGDMTRAHNLAAVVEFIHSATLLHDDVVDESDTRRGQDSASQVFGNKAAVLVGDFLFSRSFQMMVSDGDLGILKVLSDASAVIASGEVMQLSTANNLETTLDDYVEVIKAKTAALFAAACEVGPMLACHAEVAEQRKRMHDYGMNMGIAFQIADDALDYAAERKTLGKTIGDDFREGKMTAPIIFALQKADAEERDFWTRTIERRDQTPDDLQTAMNIFERHNALDQSMDMARTFAAQAKEALTDVPEHELKTVLSDLADYVVSRKS